MMFFKLICILGALIGVVSTVCLLAGGVMSWPTAVLILGLYLAWAASLCWVECEDA